MKKVFWLLLAAVVMVGCGNKTEQSAENSQPERVFPTPDTLLASPDIPGKSYIVACHQDEAHIYREALKSKEAFLLIAKGEYRLYVYDINGTDTLLAASFPVCYALNTGQKTGEGDNCTPECDMQHPFTISEIKDASSWCFDFQDGRGSILAFGHWFMRLDLSGGNFANNPAVANNRSIGIHGSTGNEMSVPGRDSHGCIRMRDADLDVLHAKYAHEGMRVVIRPYDVDKYPFERKAEEWAGFDYVAPRPGLPTAPQAQASAAPAASTEAHDGDKPLSSELSSRSN